MHSTPDLKQTGPPNVLVARADEELARAYEQITRANEEIARAEEQCSKLERDAGRHPLNHPQTRINTFRPAVSGKRRSLGGQAVRGFTGLTLAACIGVAAIAGQSPYGDAVKQIIARWASQLVLTSSLPPEKPGLPAQPSRPILQAAAANVAPMQPAPLAQTEPEDVGPTAAALSPELAQLLQTMARDLATVGQGIEQLKTRQEQMARDNAKAAEQLKASQEQIARAIAKASEQSLRPKTSAPRPTATSARKPVPTL
jgi:ferric-dicitrate binding protein FerR (iron transport regulator)